MWDLRMGKEINEYKGHTETVSSVAFLFGENVNVDFISISFDSSVMLWHNS